jgi:AraC family transcriptional regulator of adaptative response / DNA-3-methyladenine glycosylase II
VFLANDAAVRNGIRSLAPPHPATIGTGDPPAPGTLSAVPPSTDSSSPGSSSPDFREVSPWRSYATMHLWRAAAAAQVRARKPAPKEVTP